LALRSRRQVLVSSSSIVPNWRYPEISFHQSALGLGGPTTSATSPLGPGLGSIGQAEFLGMASDTGAEPFSPGRVPGAGTEMSSSGEVPGECTRISSLSRIEGLYKSYANTPGGGGSRLDLSRARASTASLSCRRI
jgi:hypothetical protein